MTTLQSVVSIVVRLYLNMCFSNGCCFMFQISKRQLRSTNLLL
jgi:hypothetical protein